MACTHAVLDVLAKSYTTAIGRIYTRVKSIEKEELKIAPTEKLGCH